MSWLLPEGQNCRKNRRRRQRKPEGLKSEQAYPEGSCPALRGKPAGLRIKGQATKPALPPTQAANERAPSERGSEAERQRGGTVRTTPRSPPPGGRCIKIKLSFV